jgi:two-component system, response regulator YesN
MPYKVFLVEDEITTREGIRDSVDWQSVGFELCGEASDGEIALPQIETLQPDVLITDIRMPFMDGLQLCTIIREHMAWMKIIIISGYNDFHYAQSAIKIGVTEYLLKPVSVQNLQSTLIKVAVSLDQEKSERAYLKRLRSQLDDNLFLLREKFLLRLVTGGESLISAIEQSHQLGLNIVSSFYQVILLEVKSRVGTQPVDYQTCQQVEKLISGLVSTHMDVLLTKKDIEEFVLILKGDSLDQLQQEGQFLGPLIQAEVQNKTVCNLAIGFGTPQQRLGDLHHSFAEALMNVQGLREENGIGEVKKLNQSALRRFLENENAGNFDVFFENSIRSLSEAALRSNVLKQYVFADIVLTAAQFVSDLGGNAGQLIPAIYNEDAILANLQTPEQFKDAIRTLILIALTYRDSQANNDRVSIIQLAKTYIAGHFTDSNLSLNEVASQVNFSPNHFSVVFSDETGINFRDYLIRTRIDLAKKLLQTTKIKCSEVAVQCGYNDPHYFSMIFHKNTGLTPQQFRAAAKK